MIERERQRLAALVSGDIDQAQVLHAHDYELVSPGGRTWSRDEYLGGIGSGQMRYLAFEATDPVQVRHHGTVAILRYKARIEMQMPDALDAGDFWHTDVWELRDGQWQAVWSQATRIRST